MSEQHTAEPWRLGTERDVNTPISGRGWADLASVVTRMEGSEEQCREGLANARRIVACVNALAGWQTETIERYCTDGQPGHPNLGQAFADLRSQRDELLAALLRLRGCIHETRGPNAWEALTQADEAIARAQGEAK